MTTTHTAPSGRMVQNQDSVILGTKHDESCLRPLKWPGTTWIVQRQHRVVAHDQSLCGLRPPRLSGRSPGSRLKPRPRLPRFPQWHFEDASPYTVTESRGNHTRFPILRRVPSRDRRHRMLRYEIFLGNERNSAAEPYTPRRDRLYMKGKTYFAAAVAETKVSVRSYHSSLLTL